MSKVKVDWQQEVEKLIDKDYGRAVADAQQQATALFGTSDYWEAVYTLAIQRVQMEVK